MPGSIPSENRDSPIVILDMDKVKNVFVIWVK